MDEIFSDSDFAELMYPVYSIEQGTNLMSKFPQLKKLPFFATYSDYELDRNRVIRYIIFCYDRESPIHKRYRDDESKRKSISAQTAGFPVDGEGLFEDYVDLMLKGKNQSVNFMVIDYVRQYNDPEYSILIAGQEALYQKLMLLKDPNKSSEKRDDLQVEETRGKIFDQAIKMGRELSLLSEKILTDENRYLKRDLFCVIDQKIKNRLPIGPERLVGID